MKAFFKYTPYIINNADFCLLISVNNLKADVLSVFSTALLVVLKRSLGYCSGNISLT